ncbi:MAG: hypothetical protein RR775_21265 [Massilia sp.]|uniref:hypothetical protein n=1 Tax=Massilia sp. TaxID=1882437 RepID=UPI002FC9BED3
MNDPIFRKGVHHIARCCLGAGIAAVALAGCGAGADEEAGQDDPALLAAYTDTIAYCGAEERADASAQEGGWSMTSPSKYGNPSYEASALVSPRGAQLQFALQMPVAVRDYRGATGPVVPSGLAKPEWRMGVILEGRLPARAAACVLSLAKLTTPAFVPTLPGMSAPAPVYGYTLNWRSKWATAVPVAGVPGDLIDGFEFVSTFVPGSARAFFALPKARLASTQGVAICHLGPTATSWDCATPDVADQGQEWGMTRQGVRPGVYVLTAPRG